MEKKQNIYSSLLAFQMLGVTVKKDGSNPHFGNEYATLDEILGKVKAPLNKLGVVFYWSSDLDGMTLIMKHVESDTEVTSTIPYIQKQDAQKLGSNITYNKRYSIVAMLGLEDEDDDGTKAVAPAPKMTVGEAFTKLNKTTGLDGLATAYKSLPNEMQKDTEVIALKDQLKAEYV